jgi:hypothetical protein
MGEKVGHIEYQDGKTLKALEIRSGDWLGFGSPIVSSAPNFIIMNVGENGLRVGEELRRDHVDKESLIFKLRNHAERGILHTPLGIIEIRTPELYGEMDLPSITNRRPNRNIIYEIMDLYIGESEIITALKENDLIEDYASWFQNGFDRLKTGR